MFRERFWLTVEAFSPLPAASRSSAGRSDRAAVSAFVRGASFPGMLLMLRLPTCFGRVLGVSSAMWRGPRGTLVGVGGFGPQVPPAPVGVSPARLFPDPLQHCLDLCPTCAPRGPVWAWAVVSVSAVLKAFGSLLVPGPGRAPGSTVSAAASPSACLCHSLPPRASPCSVARKLGFCLLPAPWTAPASGSVRLRCCSVSRALESVCHGPSARVWSPRPREAAGSLLHPHQNQDSR